MTWPSWLDRTARNRPSSRRSVASRGILISTQVDGERRPGHRVVPRASTRAPAPNASATRYRVAGKAPGRLRARLLRVLRRYTPCLWRGHHARRGARQGSLKFVVGRDELRRGAARRVATPREGARFLPRRGRQDGRPQAPPPLPLLIRVVVEACTTVNNIYNKTRTRSWPRRAIPRGTRGAWPYMFGGAPRRCRRSGPRASSTRCASRRSRPNC